ncbi:MAG: methyltransferase [Bacteroidota bacterium]|nr:methyltransferase [Odoribacter sp.]MDP3643537.1 methyltransferase [Bacteroidota bacterium]
MNNITTQIYRVIVPKFIRKRILAKRLPISIRNYYDSLPEAPSEEIQIALNYLRTNPLAVFPYDFQNEYIAGEIEVFDDQEKGLRFVVQDGKKLYFKKRWGKKKIQNLYNLLSKEQDIRSPHRYLTGEFTFNEGEILVDVGAAEGNFALSVVERVSRIVLFEADKEWIEPLKATFEPWKEKVLIVNKFVSDITNHTNTRLDDYILNEDAGIFLKIDVEGAESRLLNGCKRILSEQKLLKVAICTYHKQNDENEFSAVLARNGLESSHSDGFMLFFYDKKMKAPYFRRGLLRTSKLKM